MGAVIEARAAGYSVHGQALVRAASLALENGQITIIIGPNGAGKSTFLKLLSGELAPDSGEIRSLGSDIGVLPPWRLACRRAVMAQASRLAFPFLVHEIVRMGLEGHGCPEAGRSARRVEEALVRADAVHLAGRQYQTLSGGEQQRVQFARTLCQLEAGRRVEPRQALLLDEPIASLDLCHQLALMDVAREAAHHAGVAVLAVLHDLNLAAHYADRLVAMDGGQIVAAGAPAEVMTPALIRSVFRVDMESMPPVATPAILPQYCRRIDGPAAA
ncbi:MAG TPA: heme ABC transporter ATP-binding protein [Rhabdaerophilum sp.]|nr:heme ABC transporter ATP-binding protein [Rhabdaerophilum sp.]